MIEIPSFDRLKVLVVGDVMLDQYWSGEASRISPEAPVPVVKIDSISATPGGAGNAAMNLASIGVRTTLFGVVGGDQYGSELESLLKAKHVNCKFQKASDRSYTIRKLRVMGRHQQLTRIDFEEPFADKYFEKLAEDICYSMSSFDAVLFSDYGKGIQTISTKVINKANELKIPVLVDPKTDDFSCYQGATLITPNKVEFELVAGKCRGKTEIVEKSKSIIDSCNLGGLLVTQGADGMSLLRNGNEPVHIPTRAREVYDVTGAGDTVIALMTASMAAGMSWDKAAQLANIAAGLVVAKLGSATVTVPEIRRAIHEMCESIEGVLTEEALSIAIEDARAHGERIVMTNGCFDLIHSGHIKYLEEAKNLGDRLIVAVNDDDSVRRLKGASRPIKTVEERMVILSALRAVDWVVPFSEDTPQRLIEQVTPDVLVKGGDYRPEEVAGSAHVIAQGGEVKMLSFYEGHSTTNTIKNIKETEEEVA